MCRPVANTAGAAVEHSELPDNVVLRMLHREVLLTKAKLHALNYEQAVAERKLRTLKSQLRQGEPEFERLKRELEEVKNAPRGLEGTFRTAAEMERHRAQVAMPAQTLPLMGTQACQGCFCTLQGTRRAAYSALQLICMLFFPIVKFRVTRDLFL